MNKDKLELICLGTGNGMSHVMKGIASSAFVILKNDIPFLLVDTGSGVAHAYRKIVGEQFPPNIFLTHNHLDHTGDLPILLVHYNNNLKIQPHIYGHKDVLDIVKTYRLHELSATGFDLEELAIWKSLNLEDELYFIDENIQIQVFKTRHSYLCYGFLLFYKTRLFFAYSADTAYDEIIYDIVSSSPIAVVDGREKRNENHASFNEIELYASLRQCCRYYIIHHESKTVNFQTTNIEFLSQGMILSLQEPSD